MLFANWLYEEQAGRIIWHAMPILLMILGIFAIAYRFYSAFLAVKVLALDDTNITPAHRLNDGKDYHPTSKWVAFGHHFAAISGAGPLIGPVLALQYGYAPGLFWLVIGVCLAGAVQDMMVLAASIRCGGKSLASIAREELGPSAHFITSLAIVFIVIIALAGLGFVVVKALGGEAVALAKETKIAWSDAPPTFDKEGLIHFPTKCLITLPGQPQGNVMPESFLVKWAGTLPDFSKVKEAVLPPGCSRLMPGSSWGVFTIACTIPIALLVGWYMYRLRPGKVGEASILGMILVLAATFFGAWIPGSALEPYFSLNQTQTTIALCVYGFIASVLPVWLLLAPRDYLSSYLKIGTIFLLVLGTILANPVMAHPPINDVFSQTGPTFPGSVFPFVFICIMCGAISGFHSLVASGTTPKLVDKESHVRFIGYGGMLMEGLVGVVALIAAAAMPLDLYYDINIPLAQTSRYQEQLTKLYAKWGIPVKQAQDPMHRLAVDNVSHLDLSQVETMVGGESLRGRTGGAVTLAVSMALIFTEALTWTGWQVQSIMKYWYHFAIMFEALFILTTIDAGTRIARFLMQEMLGHVHPKLARTDWLPGSILATAIVTIGWGLLVGTGSIDIIWPMFGIANQLLAVAALAIITTLLMNRGKKRYALCTLLPMLFVTTTTMYAGSVMITGRFLDMIRATRDVLQDGVMVKVSDLQQNLKGWLCLSLALFVMLLVGALLLMAAARWLKVLVRPKN